MNKLEAYFRLQTYKDVHYRWMFGEVWMNEEPEWLLREWRASGEQYYTENWLNDKIAEYSKILDS